MGARCARTHSRCAHIRRVDTACACACPPPPPLPPPVPTRSRSRSLSQSRSRSPVRACDCAPTHGARAHTSLGVYFTGRVPRSRVPRSRVPRSHVHGRVPRSRVRRSRVSLAVVCRRCRSSDATMWPRGGDKPSPGPRMLMRSHRRRRARPRWHPSSSREHLAAARRLTPPRRSHRMRRSKRQHCSASCRRSAPQTVD